MSMMFQSGTIFTDINIFENVAFPLRRHTSLSEPLLHSKVLMKLEAVDLRWASSLMPAELSGGMVRRAALACTITLNPELIMFDEPFVGQDPIAMRMLVKLIDELNHVLGITCIIMSHDVSEALSISDYACIVASQHVLAEGTPVSFCKNQDPMVRQFLDGISDEPVSFNVPAEDYQTQLLSAAS